ncbi:unnamed protein product [Laminaria digitata]
MTKESNIGKDSSSSSSLEEARRGYALSKATALSSQLQETSVAKFEVDHLPERREVYVKRGALMYLTPRQDARAALEDSERALGEKLAAMQAVALANTDRKP